MQHVLPIEVNYVFSHYTIIVDSVSLKPNQVARLKNIYRRMQQLDDTHNTIRLRLEDGYCIDIITRNIVVLDNLSNLESHKLHSANLTITNFGDSVSIGIYGLIYTDKLELTAASLAALANHLVYESDDGIWIDGKLFGGVR